ncbi:MAG: DUF1559 family PulG-like putative transporter [Planctomycetaceae bacterium]
MSHRSLVTVLASAVGGFLLFLLLLFWPKIRGAGEAAARTQCKNNLKQIGIALRQYQQDHGTYPPAYLADVQGRPMHSWRVLILPYLGNEGCRLSDEYRLDEPWSGPNNKKLLEKVPEVYRCPTYLKQRGACRACTSYAAITGTDCAFHGAEPLAPEDFSDELENAAFIVERIDTEIPWTKPDDYRPSEHPQAGDRFAGHSAHEGGFHILLGDASVRFVSQNLPPATWRALCTRSGGEAVGNY